MVSVALVLIWTCASVKWSSMTKRMFSPLWSTGVVIGPLSQNVPPHACAFAPIALALPNATSAAPTSLQRSAVRM